LPHHHHLSPFHKKNPGTAIQNINKVPVSELAEL
jgi:hypothetical protein